MSQETRSPHGPLGPNTALIGRPGSRAALDTPALLLDLPAFGRNLTRMAERTAARGLALRPHAKTHKCVEIARRQVAAGAIGISCVTLREAETMIAGGIPGVLLTAPLVTPAQIARLMALATRAAPTPHGTPSHPMVVVDDADNAAALSAAAAGLGRPLDVLVDFNAGYHRTGTTTEAQAVALARTIQALPNLALRGLQAYAGNIQHVEDRNTRGLRAAALREAVARILAMARADGIALPIVTGAGTGTHDLDGAPFTELQPGSYLFGDAQYAPVLAQGLAAPPFETALFVQGAVISVNPPDWVVLDAGVKSMATDGPLPLVARGASPASVYAFFGDEYGRLTFHGPRPALGAKVELVTPHCDPTVNLNDHLHVVDGETLVDIWRIDARGH